MQKREIGEEIDEILRRVIFSQTILATWKQVRFQLFA
jgi:hypothetical protein